MSYQVKLTREAEENLLRLYDVVLAREIDRTGGGDLGLAEHAIVAIESGPKPVHPRAWHPFWRDRLRCLV